MGGGRGGLRGGREGEVIGGEGREGDRGRRGGSRRSIGMVMGQSAEELCRGGEGNVPN